jgi:hypothetical protein
MSEHEPKGPRERKVPEEDARGVTTIELGRSKDGSFSLLLEGMGQDVLARLLAAAVNETVPTHRMHFDHAWKVRA